MATQAWLGTAAPIPQVQTLTINGGDAGWATGDTISLTINNKTITYTVGTTSTVVQILDDIVAWLTNGSLGNGASVDQYGPDVGEFAQFTSVTEDGSDTVTIIGADDGREFTLTSAETTAGAGTTTVPVPTSGSGTGPSHFDNADNWSQGTVPVDADDIVFDHRAAASLKYGLSQSAITPASITVKPSFKYQIGLPQVNTDNPSTPYDEYETQYLTLGVSADATDIQVHIDAANSSLIKIDNNTSQATVLVDNTGPRTEPGVPTFLWKGSSASNSVTVNRGDVGIGFLDGDSASAPTLRLGYVDSRDNDARVVCGDSVTLTTVTMVGGSLETNGNIGTSVTMEGGTLTHRSGTIATLTIGAGTAYYTSTGTLTTLLVNGGGTIDFRRDVRSRTVTNCSVYAGAAYYDSFGTVTHTNGIDLVQCRPSDLRAFEIPSNKTITLSTI